MIFLDSQKSKIFWRRRSGADPASTGAEHKISIFWGQKKLWNFNITKLNIIDEDNIDTQLTIASN